MVHSAGISLHALFQLRIISTARIPEDHIAVAGEDVVHNFVVFVALPKGFIESTAGEDHLLPILHREGKALKFLRNDFRVEGQLHDFFSGNATVFAGDRRAVVPKFNALVNGPGAQPIGVVGQVDHIAGQHPFIGLHQHRPDHIMGIGVENKLSRMTFSYESGGA